MKERWGRHSELMAVIANVHRDPKQRRRPYTADDFNPYREKRERKPGIKVSMGAMMDAIFGRKTERLQQELMNRTAA